MADGESSRWPAAEDSSAGYRVISRAAPRRGHGIDQFPRLGIKEEDYNVSVTQRGILDDLLAINGTLQLRSRLRLSSGRMVDFLVVGKNVHAWTL